MVDGLSVSDQTSRLATSMRTSGWERAMSVAMCTDGSIKRLRREIDNGVVDGSSGDAKFLEYGLEVQAEAFVMSV